MKHLRWLSFILCLLMFTFIASAVMYGRAYGAPLPPAQLQTVGLDECNGKLCLFQITPGVTTWSDGKQLFAANTLRDEGDHFHSQLNGLAIRVEMDSTGSQIDRIDVQGLGSNPSSSPLRLIQIIDRFGIPCYVVSVMPGNRGLVLAYPSFQVSVLADQNHVTLNSPVSGITLVGDSNLDTQNRLCDRSLGGSPWRGFASLPLYQTLMMSSWSNR